MDSPVTKLMFIAAAVAAAALVVAVMWTTLGNNAPQSDDSVKDDKINSKALCDAIYGSTNSKWDEKKTPKCNG